MLNQLSENMSNINGRRGKFKKLKDKPSNAKFYTDVGEVRLYKHPTLNIYYEYDTNTQTWYRFYPET